MRTAKVHWLQTLTAIACASLALWTSFGALGLTEGDAVRVGVLPSFWWLAPAIAVIAIVAIASGHQRIALLWPSLLVLLPWIPLPMPPAALVWAGPLKWLVWIAIAATIAVPPLVRAAPSRWRDVLVSERRAPLAAAAIAAVAYLVAAWQISPQLPSGDEPHYLVIAQSLITDGDLQIANNHARGDYRDYFPGPLRPHYLTPGKNGQIYSVHAPGLSAVVAPVFAVSGYAGVLACLALVSAFGTSLAWRAAWLVTRDAAASWFGWAVVALTVPFLFQAFTVYPDGLGATLVMIAMLVALRGERASARTLATVGALVALLPWLHSRFAVTAAALGAVVAARQLGAPDRVRRIAAFAAVPVVGAAAWFAFFYVIYGTPNPAAPYGGYTQSSPANVPRGLTGLLIDQQFGVLVNAPVYLAVFAGIGATLRRSRRAAIELALVVVPYSVAAAFYFMWWGGLVSPARFLASILLPLAIPAAAWFADSGRATRMLALGGLLVSLLMSAALAGVDRGALVYNTRDGYSKLVRWTSPVVDISTGLPSLFQTTPLAAIERALVWLLAVAATAAASAWLAKRRSRRQATLVAAIGLIAAASASAALSIVWALNAVNPAMAASAGPRVLGAIDADRRQIAVEFDPPRRLRVADVAPLLPLTAPTAPSAGQRPGDPIAVVTDAPAAVYSVEATIHGAAGALTAGLDRQPAPLWRWNLAGLQGPWKTTLTLVNDARALRFDADPATRAAIGSVTVRAVRRLPGHERASMQTALGAARYGPATVFLLGGLAYIEPAGSWIAGGASADFAIVPDAGAPGRLFVRNAAVANDVRLDTEGWHERLSLAPHEERTLDVPFAPDRTGFVLTVRAERGARPSDLEPGNEDRRLLGCWIETR